jgi:hypothetical protein
MKTIFSITLLLFSLIGFSQEKLVEKLTVNGIDFKVIETVSPNNKEEKLYEVQKVLNDSVLSKIEIIKSYKNDLEDYNSTFKMIDSVFTFKITLKKKDQTLYAINRVFISPKGNLVKGLEYDNLTVDMPDENTYPAQFEGGVVKLRQWVQINLDAQKLLLLSPMGNLKLSLEIDVDEKGTAILRNVTGSDQPKVKAEMERIVKKMPKWIPAREKNKKVVSKFHIPVNVIGID